MRRGSGVLLHITSLPSPYGIGDLGSTAYRFVDILAGAKQRYWQILPVNPTEPGGYYSPYHSISAFAYNPLLIGIERLVREGLLTDTEVEPLPDVPNDHVDYPAVHVYKERIYRTAYERFAQNTDKGGYETFCSENAHWLDDYALFRSLRTHFQKSSWNEWPPEIRDRHPEALQLYENELRDSIAMEKFLQYIFHLQWRDLKLYANERSIQIIGDIPMYVGYESADVWGTPEIFKLDREKKPYAVSGVPPDYFSETGQLWGDPLYHWDVLRETRYAWWVKRFERNLNLFDVVRVDHFRGLVAYWEVPASETTAVNGKWIDVPADDFFATLLEHVPSFPIIAEDLGTITPDVTELMHRFGFPGMKVLQFAFGGDIATNPYIPHNIPSNSVIYTGTHDNNTTRGWFEREATPEVKERVFRYLGREVSVNEIPWEMIRLAMMSVADLAIIPLQDLLGLGESARMNRPASQEGNWVWRVVPEQLTPDVFERFREMTEIYGRA
jgi:4-alpha-glucanotransferase